MIIITMEMDVDGWILPRIGTLWKLVKHHPKVDPNDTILVYVVGIRFTSSETIIEIEKSHPFGSLWEIEGFYNYFKRIMEDV